MRIKTGIKSFGMRPRSLFFILCCRELVRSMIRNMLTIRMLQILTTRFYRQEASGAEKQKIAG